MKVSGTVYEYSEDGRYRPTQEIWNHTNVTITDAVVEVMKKNGLAKTEHAHVDV